MSRMLKSALAALIAVVAFGAMAAGSASATTLHPLFITQSGGPLLISGSGGPVTYHWTNGVVVHCNTELWHGFIQAGTNLEHRINISLHGNCILLVNGMSTSCTAPISWRIILNTIGLASSTNKKVEVLTAPSEGTEFGKIICGANEVKLEGAVVAEIPELNSKGENQYNKLLSKLEVVYASEKETEKEKLTEIFLSETLMTKVELKLAGLPGSVSLESKETLEADGLVEIDTQ